ncbi:histidine phosphatase family protein [Rhizobium tubonense]|uniref:Histidine phosphatase family protein n=1 Tax=Rhizobium tubonense TaxID=484088 RepID=A0A2W4CC22_9HYPH|nr:histidine phosphatase family protein [Rhizobium tubonense]PZM10802.1 histidine phosphatase family protein [Rhizobium tubonense]
MKGLLTWVCHGATVSNRTATFPGDEPLEEKAIAQTKMLKGLLERADRVWISPTLRTRQTSEILSLQGEPDTALRDCDYGRWSGKAIGDLHVIEPENVAVWLTDMTAAPHGGESLAALSERVAVWVDHRLGERGHTIAITHASVIRAALLHVLQAPPSAFWKIDVEPLSVVQMSGDGRRWTLRFPSQARSII